MGAALSTLFAFSFWVLFWCRCQIASGGGSRQADTPLTVGEPSGCTVRPHEVTIVHAPRYADLTFVISRVAAAVMMTSQLARVRAVDRCASALICFLANPYLARSAHICSETSAHKQDARQTCTVRTIEAAVHISSWPVLRGPVEVR